MREVSHRVDKTTYAQIYIQKKLEQKDTDSLLYLLCSKRGRWFLARLFDHCYIYKKLPSVKEKFLIAEGSRQIALITYQALQKIPDKTGIKTMEIEYNKPFTRIFPWLKDRKSMKYLLTDPNGRWYLSRIFESCQLSETAFAGTEKENAMFIFEGNRKVAIWLYKMICHYRMLKYWQLAKKEYSKWQQQIKLIAADDAENNIQEDE